MENSLQDVWSVFYKAVMPASKMQNLLAGQCMFRDSLLYFAASIDLTPAIHKLSHQGPKTRRTLSR